MFLFTSPISVNISEVFVYLLPIRSFPDSPKYRADPISDPVIGSGLVIITIVIIKLKLWPAAGCEAKVAAELSSHPLDSLVNRSLSRVMRQTIVLRVVEWIAPIRFLSGMWHY